MIEHVSLRCADPRKSRGFYEKALKPLGYALSKRYGDAFGFKQGGRHDFWIGEGEVATPSHVGFTAATHEDVDAFYKAAMKAGGKDHGPPGVRKGYGYAAFVFDPDGHNVEAVCFDELGDGKGTEAIQRKRIAKATASRRTTAVRQKRKPAPRSR